ncbi:39S ribosomal protein L36, mitochondrial [Trichosurus vulpecula]|uniref:39S ribosomal protein L36, mitochondrial n=1 Tax=Trichosurus vulpecula TaxID=9337 RepID=UPI00186ACD73|nr:39S ribosomal protein L36, mitochondrial [Trichosurus vulpecula]
MTSLFVKKMMLAISSPLFHMSRCSAKPSSISAFLFASRQSTVSIDAAPMQYSSIIHPFLSRYLLPSFQPALGFKTKAVLKKRCKDCYFVKRRGRWFVYCATNPRHKQRQLKSL